MGGLGRHAATHPADRSAEGSPDSPVRMPLLLIALTQLHPLGCCRSTRWPLWQCVFILAAGDKGLTARQPLSTHCCRSWSVRVRAGCARSDRSRNKLRMRPFEPKQTFGHCGIQEKRSARNLLENMTKMNISTSPPRLQIGRMRAGRAVVLFRLRGTFSAPAGIAGRQARLPGSGDCGSATRRTGRPGCPRRAACPTRTER